MAAKSAAVLARIERSGMGVITPIAGLRMLETLLSDTNQRAPQVRKTVPYHYIQPLNQELFACKIALLSMLAHIFHNLNYFTIFLFKHVSRELVQIEYKLSS